MDRYVFTPAEALRACSTVIDEYEQGALMTDVRVAFAKQMFAALSREDAQVVVRSYPFRDIITNYDMICFF